MVAANPTTKTFVVAFKNLERWSVGSFAVLTWKWPAAMIRPLSHALHRKCVPVDGTVTPHDPCPLVTLHFNGEIEPRQQQGGIAVKGRLFCADAGDVLYSKIDVRNGAMGIVPGELSRVHVTSEYPVYTVDPQVAEAAYVKLLFRTDTFRRKINSMISGASGRKRVQPTDLENIDVPLPPLAIQRAIVTCWNKVQAQVLDTLRTASELEEAIEFDLLSALGLFERAGRLPTKAFSLRWKDVQRWSVMYNELTATQVDISKGQYPVTTLGEVASVSYGIQKSPANRPGQDSRPYLRVANVQQGELDLSEIKYINVPDSDMPTYRLQYDDLLVCEGNSAHLVGRPAIWNGEIPDCVHQNHVFKVRADPSHLLPHYLLEYMRTGLARDHFRSRAKFTTNLASINSNDLKDLPIPLPDLDTQRALVDKICSQRKRTADLKALARQRADEARSDVEAMIIGEKAVDENYPWSSATLASAG